MNVKPDHRAAGTFIDINTFYIQRVNGKNVAMGFAFRRRCAIVPGFTKVGTRLQTPSGIATRPEPNPCGTRVSAGKLTTTQCHQPEPVGASGS